MLVSRYQIVCANAIALGWRKRSYRNSYNPRKTSVRSRLSKEVWLLCI
ncbi:MAG: hypothetical protein AB1861_15585 [Cyanobacteriota bacterium]